MLQDGSRVTRVVDRKDLDENVLVLISRGTQYMEAIRRIFELDWPFIFAIRNPVDEICAW